MTTRDQLVNDRQYKLCGNVFYQVDLDPEIHQFEKRYIKLRSNEGRLYPDDVVKNLPFVSPDHPLIDEWEARSLSLGRLSTRFRTAKCKRILEVGCGNGWLSHRLASIPDVEICAIDVNEPEIVQGAKIFSELVNLHFIYGDIFTIHFESIAFDAIVLASSIQYFPDIKSLFRNLLKKLTPDGEIHIIDSPLYRTEKAALSAKERSNAYFTSAGMEEMQNHYFHHYEDQLKDFNHDLLFDPHSLTSRILRRMIKRKSIFPWIVIKHG